MKVAHLLFSLSILIPLVLSGCAGRVEKKVPPPPSPVKEEHPVKGPDMEAREFISSLEERVKGVEKELNLAYWSASISGRDDDYEKYSSLEIELRKIFSEREGFLALRKFLKEYRISDPVLHRSIQVLFNGFLENQIDRDLMEAIVKKGALVEKLFNTWRGRMEGREVTMNEIREILKHDKNERRRRIAWEVSKEVGKAVEGELLELIRMRNRAARSLGFEDFYELRMEVNELDEVELFRLFKELAEQTEEPFILAKKEIDRTIAKGFGIPSSKLMPWHYQDPFFQEAPKLESHNLDKYFRDRDVIEIGKAFYKSLGMEVEPILSRSDLFEKPGKVPHAYCISIDRGEDVRILTNIVNNSYWMSTLLHELGHAVYDYYIGRDVPYFLHQPSHILTTECIAELMERLVGSGRWLKSALDIDEGEAARLDEMNRKYIKNKLLVFARWCLVMINFERELYRNPESDLNGLWWRLVEKYQKLKTPPGRGSLPDWAAKIHFSSSPVYYHNYILGEMMGSQIVDYIRREILGGVDAEKMNFYGEKRVGDYLIEKVFKPGATLKWKDLIREATGEEFTIKYFIQDISS